MLVEESKEDGRAAIGRNSSWSLGVGTEESLQRNIIIPLVPIEKRCREACAGRYSSIIVSFENIMKEMYYGSLHSTVLLLMRKLRLLYSVESAQPFWISNSLNLHRSTLLNSYMGPYTWRFLDVESCPLRGAHTLLLKPGICRSKLPDVYSWAVWVEIHVINLFLSEDSLIQQICTVPPAIPLLSPPCQLTFNVRVHFWGERKKDWKCTC